jgi:arginase
VADIRLIAVPYELGRLRDGVGAGPERLLEHGAAEALAARGAAVEITVIELDEPDDNEVDTSFAVIGRLAETVRAAREAGEFPVVLSGSCLAAVGVVAGLGEAAPGVVWFDAHGDFNEPQTSVYGYLDGMGMAILVGDAWQGLAGQVPGAGPVPESAVVLAGARALDEPELPRLEASAINHLPTASLADPATVVEAVAAMEPKPSGVYLHLDLDVLDSSVARVNRYAAADGISAAALEASVRALLADQRVHAVSLTAYEPAVDPEGRVPPIAMRLLGAVAESRAA